MKKNYKSKNMELVACSYLWHVGTLVVTISLCAHFILNLESSQLFCGECDTSFHYRQWVFMLVNLAHGDPHGPAPTEHITHAFSPLKDEKITCSHSHSFYTQ